MTAERHSLRFEQVCTGVYVRKRYGSALPHRTLYDMPSLAVETSMGRTRYIRPVVPIVAVEMLQREAAIADNGVDTTLRATYALHNGARVGGFVCYIICGRLRGFFEDVSTSRCSVDHSSTTILQLPNFVIRVQFAIMLPNQRTPLKFVSFRHCFRLRCSQRI